MDSSVYKAVAVAIASVGLLACSRDSRELEEGRKCVGVSQALLKNVLQQDAIKALPGDVRDELEKALKTEGKLCLAASMEIMTCNSGNARAPEEKRCCRFSQPPEATLTGLPNRIRVRRGTDPQAPDVVDLTLKGALTDLALDQRCLVPICDGDRAVARPHIDLTGRITTDSGSLEVNTRLDLDAVLGLGCSLPDAANGAS